MAASASADREPHALRNHGDDRGSPQTPPAEASRSRNACCTSCAATDPARRSACRTNACSRCKTAGGSARSKSGHHARFQMAATSARRRRWRARAIRPPVAPPRDNITVRPAPIVIAGIRLHSLRQIAMINGQRRPGTVVKLQRISVIEAIVREPGQRRERRQRAEQDRMPFPLGDPKK